MSDTVNHPVHYTSHPSGVECIEVTRMMSFTLGNAVKYIWRASAKNGREDWEKARWYLKDTLRNGCGWSPPFKAKQLLARVAAADDDPTRKYVFGRIADGELLRTVQFLDGLIEGLPAARKEGL